MSPIERAAEAVRVALDAQPTASGLWMTEGGYRDQAHFKDVVIAVLNAVREPSESMVQAAPEDRNRPIYPEDIWQAMIDAAIEEG